MLYLRPALGQILTILAIVHLTHQTTSTASSSCTCYLISGPNPGYFQHHLFWDFRSIPSVKDNDYTFAPPLITSSQSHGTEPPTSPFFTNPTWTDAWSIQNWTQPANSASPIKSVNSAQNLYISRNSTPGSGDSTYLTLRTSRLADFMSIVEFDSNRVDIMHCSFRARLRIIPSGLANPTAAEKNESTDSASSDSHDDVAPGAVLGFFTYASDTSESDIEILTRDPVSQIRYSNQPDYDAATDASVPGASTDAVLPRHEIYTEWLTHRLDWLLMFTRFWVDGEIVLGKSVNVPRQASGVVLNLWGDGGDWSGNMSVGESVIVGVEWMELVFNVSGSSATTGCEVGCRIDGVKKVGIPEVVFDVTASGNGAGRVGKLKFEIVGGLFFMLLGYSLHQIL